MSAQTALALRSGHTERDFNELVAAGVDPDSTQPRERSVGCIACRKSTLNQSGYCDAHYVRPFAIDRAELDDGGGRAA